MTERLTENNKTGWVLKLDDPQNEFEARQQLMSKFKLACEKLGKLEDILEKYGIESVEELEDKIICYEENKDVNLGLKLDIKKLEQELDTWKRACELACKEAPIHCPDPPEYYNAQNEYGSDEPYYIQVSACEFGDDVGRCRECQMDYFYQQAKKEMEG